jgi:hypothetical protein
MEVSAMEYPATMTKVRQVLWPYPTRIGRLKGVRSVGPQIPYWQENRWRWDRAETTLSGRFRTPYCAPKGKITRHHDGTFTVFIYDPPEQLWTHPYKKDCFRLTPGTTNEYRVNFLGSVQARTIDGAIMEVERTLVEAFELVESFERRRIRR